MKWTEVAIWVTHEAAEAVANRLMELRGGGVAIDDPSLIYRYQEKYREASDDHFFQLPQPKFLPDEVVVKAYFPEEQITDDLIAELRHWVANLAQFGLNPGKAKVSCRSVKEEDWSSSWKAYYHPVHIGDRLVIKPSWEDYDDADAIVIDIDPGMAFGTGTHPTTALCLCGLEKYARSGDTVFDVGTGSGVLAIAAAKLGAGFVEAIDIDPVAVSVARENVERNGVSQVVSIYQGTIENISGRAHLITANIIASVIIEIAPQLAKRLVPNGICLASGIIDQKASDVCQALNSVGLEIVEIKKSNEWVLLVARKSNSLE